MTTSYLITLPSDLKNFITHTSDLCLKQCIMP